MLACGSLFYRYRHGTEAVISAQGSKEEKLLGRGYDGLTMLVYFQKPTIFVKTSKTASTSSEAFLQRAIWGTDVTPVQGWQVQKNGFCTPRGHFTEAQNQGAARHFQLPWNKRIGAEEGLSISKELSIVINGNFPWSTLRRIRKLRSHSGREAIVHVLGEEFWIKALKIINIRNPFDRLVSEYFYKFRNVEEVMRPSFEDFVQTKQHDNLRAYGIDENGLVHFIRYENLAEDLDTAVHLMGLSPPTGIPTFKSNIRPQDRRDYRVMFSEISRAHVEKVYKATLDQFSYSF